MLKVQISQLPGNVAYCLDSAVECLELDAGSHAVLTSYGDRRVIGAVLDGYETLAILAGVEGRENVISFGRQRKERYARLHDYADELLAQMTPAHQLGAAIMGVNYIRYAARSHAEFFAVSAISDQCEGGCLEPFRFAPPSWTPYDEDPPKRAGRRLHARRWIRRYLKRMQEVPIMRGLLKSAARRYIPRASPALFDKASTIFEDEAALYAEVRALQEREEIAAFHVEHGLPLPPALADIQVSLKPGVLRKLRDDRKRYRKVAKRAAILASSLMGAADVGRFARGQTVYLPGETMTLAVTRRSTIFSSGHGAIQVAVHGTGASNIKLADLCVYVKDTPAIDQLAAFHLAMQAGEERAVLSDANIIRVTEAGSSHPALAARYRPEPEADGGATAAGMYAIHGDRHTDRKDRNERYWDETREVWVEETGIAVFGPKWRKVFNEDMGWRYL